MAGLTTAYELQKRGLEVVVLEAADRPGGKLRTGEVGGRQIEDGADAFLPRDDAPIQLCNELGLHDLVSPAIFGAYIWHGGMLRKLPAGSPYGIPSSPLRAWRSGLLSSRGALRAGAEVLNPLPLRGPDISIGHFVRRRFGNEVLENMVDPLLAGVRGGSSLRISLAAGAKEIDILARGGRSVLRALSRNPAPHTGIEKQGDQAPEFLAPSGGMQRLSDALAARVEVRTGSHVQMVAREGNGFRVSLASDTMSVDGVVLALPSHHAAPLLDALDGSAASSLRKIGFASATIVGLVYPRSAFSPPPDGSGFLVPSGSGLSISGCTWYSAKWPDKSGSDDLVLRCVLGRDPLHDHDDAAVLTNVARDLEAACGITSAPTAHRITRWADSIPLLEPGHLDLVDDIERTLSAHGPLMVTGAGYRGAGIPDCISGALRTAASMAHRLDAGLSSVRP